MGGWESQPGWGRALCSSLRHMLVTWLLAWTGVQQVSGRPSKGDLDPALGAQRPGSVRRLCLAVTLAGPAVGLLWSQFAPLLVGSANPARSAWACFSTITSALSASGPWLVFPTRTAAPALCCSAGCGGVSLGKAGVVLWVEGCSWPGAS